MVNLGEYYRKIKVYHYVSLSEKTSPSVNEVNFGEYGTVKLQCFTGVHQKVSFVVNIETK